MMAQIGCSAFTEENANFFRYSSMLLDLGAEVLRNVFQIYLGQTSLKQFLLNNKTKLDTLLNKKILSQHQYDLVFPQQGDPDIRKYDITLMFCLLRNLNSNIRAGDQKWTQPSVHDKSLEADVGRIREIRNRLHGHVSSTSMSTVSFQKEKIELESIYVRLVKKVPSSPRVTLLATDVKDQIKKLSEEVLEPTRQQMLLQGLNAWYHAVDLPREISQIRDRISDVKQTVTECTEDLKQTVDSVISPLKTEVAAVKTDLEKLSYDIKLESVCLVDKRLQKRRIYDTKIEIQDFIETTKEYHLELTSVTEARKTLEEHNRLILTGHPGAGKSHMAMTLLNRLLKESSVNPVILREVDEWEKVIDPDVHMCIFIDDFLGKFNVDIKDKNSWQNLVPALKVYTKSGKTKFIATMRTSILEEINMKQSGSKIVELFGPSVIDLSSEKYKMKTQEKKTMVVKYSKKLDIDKKDMTAICTGEEIIGFPQCCKLLTDCVSKELVLSIFQHPVEHLVREIKNLLSTCPLMYSVLALTLLLGGTLCPSTLHNNEVVASRVLNICGLEVNKVMLIPDIASSLSHSGAFLTYQEHSETYIFAHDTIHEAVFTSFVERFPKETLECSSMDLIARSCILRDNSSNAKSSKDKNVLSGSFEIAVNVNHIPILIHRFLQLVQEKTNIDYADMTKSKLWLDSRFQQKMVQTLDSFGLLLAKDNNGESLLVHAVQAGNLSCVTTLLEAVQTSSSIDEEDLLIEKRLALQIACKYQELSVVRVLTKEVCYISDDVMFEAARAGHVIVMKELISNHGNFRCERNDGYTLLHCACRHGNLELVQFLVNKIKDSGTGETHALCSFNDQCKIKLIHFAVVSGNVDLVKFILDSGVKPITRTFGSNATILHFACQYGHIELVKYLLELFPEFLCYTDCSGATPLHCSALNGHIEILKYLILREAGVKHVTDIGFNLMHTSCWLGRTENIEMLQYLISEFPWMMEEEDNRGRTPADIAILKSNELLDYLLSAAYESNRTILHVACEKKQLDVVKNIITSYPDLLEKKDDSRETPLHKAAEAGDVTIVDLLVDAGAKVDCRNCEGLTPLNFACSNMHLGVVKKLVRSGAAINFANNDGFTPLMQAAVHGDTVMFRFLLQAGADIECNMTILHLACQNKKIDFVKYLITTYPDILEKTDDYQKTPLHEAAEVGDAAIVNIMLEAGAKVDCRNCEGLTPLNLACSNMHLGVVKKLVRSGAAINFANNHGFTPLMQAAVHGDTDMFTYLLKVGADIECKTLQNKTVLHLALEHKQNEIVQYIWMTRSIIYDKIDKESHTELHAAAVEGYLSRVQKLVELGEDIRCRTLTSRNVLHVACSAGHLDVVKYLLKQCGELLSECDVVQMTPLHNAVVSGSVEVVQCLVSAGADIGARGVRGATPLHLAAFKGHQKIVEFLLSLSTDLLNKKDKNQCTPLLQAAMGGHVNVVKYLVQAGADIRSTGVGNLTILHAACEKKRLDVVKYLITTYPDLLEKTADYQKKPLHEAAEVGDAAIVNVLVDAGAKVDCKSKGLTPLNLACSNMHSDVAKKLVRSGAAVNSSNNHGFTPLMQAAVHGDTDMFMFLLEAGADIECKTLENKTVLHLALEHKQNEIVRYIWMTRSIICDKIDKESHTELHAAAVEGYLSRVKTLVGLGEDIRCRTLTSRNVLHVASSAGHLDVVKYLLKQCGELLSECNVVHMTPLHEAVVSGSVEVVQCLVSAGADIGARGLVGATPLHLAAFIGHQKVVELLLSLSPDLLNIKDEDQCTPLLKAAIGGHVNVVKYLVQAGADIRSTCVENKTILHAACQMKRLNAVKYLITTYPDLLNKESDYQWSPLHEAARTGDMNIMKVLVKAGASVEHRNVNGKTAKDIAQQENNDAVAQYLEKRSKETADQQSSKLAKIFKRFKMK